MTLDRISKALVRLALEEDLGRGDVTTQDFVSPGLRLKGRFLVKSAGVFCGTAAAEEVFRLAAPGTRLRWLKKDGDCVKAGTVAGVLSGGRRILSAERTALNFLQRLSGIATLTRAYAERARGTRARIFDTRKTAPGFRALDKAAVLAGGGCNHRQGLYDMAMLKDNHLAALEPAELARRLARFRRRRKGVLVELEAKTHGEVVLAARLGADVVMLDNMSRARLRREIGWLRAHAPKAGIEVSGGLGLEDIRPLARLGPDRISVGKLTHSAPALDISLELEGTGT
ncbi:MAG TPA: carboxylating nicotinate-nucleotide diphosphorylase [Elusimicrobia bacterium]|nr:carboxylating nicotinate-nucleotide diphosphorylase [Elusimicrobiota bacterium]